MGGDDCDAMILVAVQETLVFLDGLDFYLWKDVPAGGLLTNLYVWEDVPAGGLLTGLYLFRYWSNIIFGGGFIRRFLRAWVLLCLFTVSFFRALVELMDHG